MRRPSGNRARAYPWLALFLIVLATGPVGPVGAQDASPAARPAGTPAASPVAVSYPLTLPDCVGGTVTFEAPPERVVTLDAYAAEFLITLGVGDRVVGTGYPHPASGIPEDLKDDFAAIPVLTSGLAGDTQGLPGREVIAAANPGLVLTAYSVLLGEDEGTIEPADMAEIGADTFSSCWDQRTTRTTDVEDTYAFFDQLGRIFGVPDRAATIVAGMRVRQAAVTDRVAGLEPVRAFAIGTDPSDGQPIPTWGGGSLPSGIMTLAGCDNIFGDVAEDAFFPSAEEVAARDPQVLVIITDFVISDGDALIEAVADNPVLGGTSAARDGRFAVVSHVILGGPSPRNIEVVEALATACHPEEGEATS